MLNTNKSRQRFPEAIYPNVAIAVKLQNMSYEGGYDIYAWCKPPTFTEKHQDPARCAYEIRIRLRVTSADVAQLIEQLICNQQVVSLSLTIGSICRPLSVIGTLVARPPVWNDGNPQSLLKVKSKSREK